MENQNPSRNAELEKETKRLGKLGILLEAYFKKWQILPGSNQVTKVQMGVYLEALKDLTEAQLEYGCQQATKNAERFPWPGHIRKFALQYTGQEIFLGPKMIDWKERPLTEEEKKQCDDDSRKLRALLEPIAKMPKPKTVRSADQQIAEMRNRGYLK